jgi:hypothetical protein
MRSLALAIAIVVSAIIIAFAFRYTPVIDSSNASRHWSFDRWFGEFHPEK